MVASFKEKKCHLIHVLNISQNLTVYANGIAVPNNRADHPVERGIHLPRQARRLLGPRGAVSSRVQHLRTEAAEAAQHLWRLCDRQQTVVWLDNWYRKRFGSDPLSNDMSLNVSVLAVLHTTALPSFPGQLHFTDIVARLPSLAGDLLHVFTEIRRGVQIVSEADLQPEMIRVPLDIQRTGLRSLQWLPYLLTELTVSSQQDLLAIVADLETLRVRTGRCLPLLVDMDIHYRLMKLMYGQSTVKWDYAGHLSLTPLLYGV